VLRSAEETAATATRERVTMAHDEPATSGAPTKLAIKNVGLMLSGDLEKAVLDADAIIAVNGRIGIITSTVFTAHYLPHR
jgi:hypothetical protein